DTIQGPVAIMLNIGRVTGLVGLVMYALNLVYATRLRFLEYWFGGLNRVYIAHHLLGGLALIMLSLHPLFLALRFVGTSMKQAALQLIPNGLFPLNALWNTSSEYHEVVLQQWATMFGSIAFWGMVGLLLVTFFIKIPYRLWLFTHKFLGAAFFTAGLHVLFISSDTSKDPAMKWYILILTAIGLVAFIYKTLAGNIFIRKFKYKIEEVKIVAGNVTQVRMKPIKDSMSYKAGQFVFVRFHQPDSPVTREWHPFTISSSPKDDMLELSVKALGDYTNKLASLSPGTVADIEGAYGRFSYTNYSSKDQIWIAGGIGITPFLSMIKDLPPEGTKVDLYYAVKTESELIDWDKLGQHAGARHKEVRAIPFISEKQQGHLDVAFIEKTSGSIKGKDFFICGPPPMMQGLRKQLRAKGVPATSIHSEEFGMS
ncbi:ferredoxin reductase family protein, partial [Candidatus Saccharibacteria bacterium]|nr:ferredoxin reductase family protein [Candidatus Saccharibacteria bacterium]